MKTALWALMIVSPFIMSGCGVDTGSGEEDDGGTTPGTVWYVDPTQTVSGEGTAWNQAFVTLQEALAAADSGDEIWTVAGMYTPTDTSDRTVSFEMVEGVGVYGGFSGDEKLRGDRLPSVNVTVLSGDLNGDDSSGGDNSENSYHVVTGADGAVLDGFIIEGGNADGPIVSDSDPAVQLAQRAGGGLVCGLDGSMSVTVSHCTFRSNEAHVGGAAALFRCSGAVRNCTFSSNSTAQKGETAPGAAGGALFWYSDTPENIEIDQCTFSDNVCDTAGTGIGRGGAACLTGPLSALISASAFSENSARGAGNRGGALFADEGADIEVSRTEFSSNSSEDDGGAAVLDTAQCDFLLCTFSSNTASGEGGALFCRASDVLSVRSGFVSNTAAGTGAPVRGGAVHMENASSLRAWNCVFNNNLADGSLSPNESYGGAVHVWEGCTVECFFTTCSLNTADHGGALRLGSDSAGSSLTLNSCIVWGNTGNISDSEISGDPGGTVSAAYSDIQGGGFSGTGNINADPNFAGGGDLHIQGGPCVNTGDPLINPGVDIEGTSRDSQPDMGAYEYIN